MSYPFKLSFPVLGEIFAVGGDDLLVPVEGILAAAGITAGAVIISVDIDEAIALAHLTGRSGNQIDRTPGRVAQQINTVFHSLFHRFNVAAEVVDAIVIVNGTIFLDLVIGTKTILSYE